MKLRKYIGLFFLCSAVSMCLGIFIGCNISDEKEAQYGEKRMQMEASVGMDKASKPLVIRDEPVVEAATKEDKTNADTVYIIVEKDLDTGNVVETCIRIPQKYIGMTREQLSESLSDYEANPPLSELERGFVSVELLRFSTNQVEVQMNYQYIQPTESFYIVAYDNMVVVMLEDKKTVFMDTLIKVTELPLHIQQDILQGLFIPDEESLYDFLENYTS